VPADRNTLAFFYLLEKLRELIFSLADTDLHVPIKAIEWPFRALSLYFRQTIQIRIPDVALENQVRAFSFARNFNQPGRFQFFDVMRNGCSAHAMRLQQNAAGHRIAAGADLLEDLVPPGFGQCAANRGKLSIG